MLSTGSIKEIVNGKNVNNPVLQILAFKALVEDNGIDNKYRLLLTDGKYYFEGFVLLGTQNEYIKDGRLKRNSIIQLNEFYKIESRTRLKTIIAICKVTKIKDASNGCFSEKLVHYMSNSEKSSQKILLNYVSLKDISSEIKSGREYFDCTIKIKVENKSPVKTWKKNEREGIYTIMIFQDNDDKEQKIKAFNFNEELNDKIQTDMVYYLTHFKVGRKKILIYDDDIYEIVLGNRTNIIPVLKATMYSEEISNANQENIYSEDKHSNNFSKEDHLPFSHKHHAASNKSDIQEIQQENSMTEDKHSNYFLEDHLPLSRKHHEPLSKPDIQEIQQGKSMTDSNTVVKDQNWINLIIVIIVFLIIIIVLNFWVQTRLHLYLPEK